MPGSASSSRPLQYVGALVALIAVLGSVFGGWQFGDDRLLPTAIGVACVLLAVGVIAYRRRLSGPD
jgi:hypothetical protein